MLFTSWSDLAHMFLWHMTSHLTQNHFLFSSGQRQSKCNLGLVWHQHITAQLSLGTMHLPISRRTRTFHWYAKAMRYIIFRSFIRFWRKKRYHYFIAWIDFGLLRTEINREEQRMPEMESFIRNKRLNQKLKISDERTSERLKTRPSLRACRDLMYTLAKRFSQGSPGLVWK